MDNLEKIGERIKEIRENMGLNQAQFADKLGLSGPSAISKYEKGQREPEVRLLVKISFLGNKSLNWLITGEEESKSATQQAVTYYPPELQRYIDKLVAILTGPDQKQAGKLEERINIIYEELLAARDRKKKRV